MKSCLVTTALEETWPDNERVLYLGEWCRLYSRRECWLDLDAEVLPFHWDDLSKYDADYEYLSELYERVLVILAQQLNELHNVKHDLRYWRIMIGSWLAHFLPITFDRWSSIQQALNSYDISNTIILEGKVYIANDVGEFSRLMGEDEWNHYIYAFIMENYTKVPCIKKTVDKISTAQTPHSLKSVSAITKLKKKILGLFSKISPYFVKDRDVFLMNTYLPILDEIKLHLKFGQFPQLWKTVQPVRATVDDQLREQFLKEAGDSDFEKCMFDLISLHMPVLYLEGYQHLMEQIRKLPWPQHPQLIFSSNVLWHDPVSIAYVAEQVGYGVPLVYGQHGGVYGIAKYTWPEKHEVAISDRYLSWGWDVENKPNIKPIGILKFPRPSNRVSQSVNSNHKLILVTVNTSRYAYEMCREELMYYKNYFCDSFKFCNNLTKSINKNLIIRGSTVERGWYQAHRWMDRFPDIEYDPGEYRMKDLFQEARIIVYTYNSTGYLETFTLDIPTIIYWHPDNSPLRDTAIVYFEELKQVGIYHETPESAAQHIVNVWEDVDAWWRSTEVREVLERFKERYCRQNNDLLSRLEFSLKEVIDV